MTINEIINAARPILQDTQLPYRWEDSFIRDMLDEGVILLNSEVPSTRYVDGLVRDRVELPLDYNEEFPVSFRYREALVYFVVSRCYRVDDTDTVNAQLAENYYANAIQRMHM